MTSKSNPGHLRIEEWCEYWREGNDQWQSDHITLDESARQDLAWASETIRGLLAARDQINQAGSVIHDKGKGLTQHLEGCAEHLGDGAYAAWDGEFLWVWADRYEGRHAVALEPETVFGLASTMNRLAKRFEEGE